MLPQVSAVVLLTLLCKRTSSTTDLPNQQNLYKFGYTVRDESTRDFKTHQEVHDGKQVRGMYSLGEPNGDVRVVTYTADGTNGFRATVKVHPYGSPGLPTFYSDREQTKTDQHPGYYNKQTINQENKNENNFQINTTPSPIRLTNSIHINNLNTSEPQVNLKEAKLNDVKIAESEDKDIPKAARQDHLYNAQDENEQVMIIDNDYLPKTDHFEEDHELEPPLFRQSILPHFQDIPLQEPQIIPVKIQDDPSSDAELLESETNIEMSTFFPIVNEDIIDEDTNIRHSTEEVDDAYSTTKLFGENYVQDSLNVSQTQTLDHDLHKGVIKLEDSEKEIMNQHVIDFKQSLMNQGTAAKTYNITDTMKPNNNQNTTNFMVQEMITKTDNISVLTKPVLETAFNNSILESPDIKTQQQQNVTKERNPTEIRPDENIKQSSIETIKQDLILKESNTNKEIKAPEVLKNKLPIMLMALLIPTSSVLKLSCFPNMLEKEGVKATTLPSKPPFHSPQTMLQSGQNTIKSIFTTGSTVYPFQLVHFNPTWNHQLNSEDNTQFSAQHSIPTYGIRTQGSSADSTFGLQTTMSQKVLYTYPVLHETLTTFKPEQVFPSPGSESVTHPTHKLSPIGQYSHHFLPPPWAPHPFRSMHTSHHKQMPIFVLPMSHNSNFAPTFNPKLHDNNFNQ